MVVRIDRPKWRDVRRHRQELCGSDYLPAKVTGERSDGHLRQGTRHEPLFADLISPDEVQRDCGGHRKRGVQSIDLVLHEASLPAMLLTVSVGQVPGTKRSARNRLSRSSAIRPRKHTGIWAGSSG